MNGIWSEFAEEGLNEMQEMDTRFNLLKKELTMLKKLLRSILKCQC